MNPMELNSFDANHMTATLLWTNAVPQYGKSNREWAIYEQRLTTYAKEVCGPRGGTLYALTGPSRFGLADQLPESVLPGEVRVVIPVSVWTAACCVWMQDGSAMAASTAAMINNQKTVTKARLTEMNLSELEDRLTPPTAGPANLFPGNAKCRQYSLHKGTVKQIHQA